MENVGELVSDDERVPVGIVAQTRSVCRRMGEKHYAVRRKRSRVSVDVVDIVRHNQIDRATRRNQLRRELRIGSLGIHRGSTGLVFERWREVNPEMTRMKRAPVLVGRKLRAHCPRRAKEKRGGKPE